MTHRLAAHRLALVLTAASFLLLFVGGLVTSKGAGLAVPDWPTTFGHNMFLYPWSKMVGDVFYEHSHRLVASAVGLLTIALALILWLREGRNWVRWLGVTALGFVILQGVIGGLRVVFLQQTLAILHACLAQIFFALAASLAIVTSREWLEWPRNEPVLDGGRLGRLCAGTMALIYIQAIFGAVLRHTGEWLDGHLIFAALVALHVILVIARVSRFHSGERKLMRPAIFLGLLFLAQLFLGGASYVGKYTTILRLPSEMVVLLTTTHLVTGALMLVLSLVLTLRSFRFSRSSDSLVPRKVLTEQFPL